jgi:hypothetical protein
MTERTLFVEGIAFWAPGLPDWGSARAAFRGENSVEHPTGRLPTATLLTANERRRAPETVSLALEAARMAVEASGRPADGLLGIFVSANGDLPIIDNLCATLACDPLQISPTKFLHSIHNAPAGLWSMVGGGGQPNTTLTAFTFSFAAGLLEAAVQCSAEQQPVLLVGYDTAPTGALTETMASSGALAVALVLAPERSARSSHLLAWSLINTDQPTSQAHSSDALALSNNGMSHALPLFEALASLAPTRVTLAQTQKQLLQLTIEPLSANQATARIEAVHGEK